MKIAPTNVHFFDEDIEYILRKFSQKLSSGFLSQAESVEEFETDFAKYTGANYAISLNSGTAAIESAMFLKKVAGKTVLVPANANFATLVAPLRAGAKVNLVDININTLSPSVKDLEQAWDYNTVGVISVHMGGIIPYDIMQIQEWCKKKRIWLFEDCAHAHGSKLNGLHAGKFGFAGAFSFFATKVITAGEGGMLITDDKRIAEKIRLYRNLGKPDIWKNNHVYLGTNARMSELCALVGKTQLMRLDKFISYRSKIATVYTKELKDFCNLKLILPTGKGSWYKYIVMLPDNVSRKMIKEKMAQMGIKLPGEIYETPLHHQPVLKKYYRGKIFPKAELACMQHLCLPIYYGLSEKEVNYILNSLKALLTKLTQ